MGTEDSKHMKVWAPCLAYSKRSLPSSDAAMTAVRVMISARECGRQTSPRLRGGGILPLIFHNVLALLKPPHSSCLDCQVSRQALSKPDRQRPVAAPGAEESEEKGRWGGGGVIGLGGGEGLLPGSSQIPPAPKCDSSAGRAFCAATSFVFPDVTDSWWPLFRLLLLWLWSSGAERSLLALEWLLLSPHCGGWGGGQEGGESPTVPGVPGTQSTRPWRPCRGFSDLPGHDPPLG